VAVSRLGLNRRCQFDEQSGKELTEKVVFIKPLGQSCQGRTSASVLSGLISVGDKHGRRWSRCGQGRRSGRCHRKGGRWARSQMVGVCLKDATIPHEVFSHYAGLRVSACVPLLRARASLRGKPCGSTFVGSCGRQKTCSASRFAQDNAGECGQGTSKALLSLRMREDIYRGRGSEIKKAQPPARRLPFQLQLRLHSNFLCDLHDLKPRPGPGTVGKRLGQGESSGHAKPADAVAEGRPPARAFPSASLEGGPDALDSPHRRSAGLTMSAMARGYLAVNLSRLTNSPTGPG